MWREECAQLGVTEASVQEHLLSTLALLAPQHFPANSASASTRSTTQTTQAAQTTQTTQSTRGTDLRLDVSSRVRIERSFLHVALFLLFSFAARAHTIRDPVHRRPLHDACPYVRTQCSRYTLYCFYMMLIKARGRRCDFFLSFHLRHIWGRCYRI